MSATRPRYSKQEFARRGDTMYEGDIRPFVEEGNEGKFVAIDIETGAYEVDADELAASDPLTCPRPGRAGLAEADRFSLCSSFWPPPSVGRLMITGAVTADREAVIRLAARGPAGQE